MKSGSVGAWRDVIGESELARIMCWESISRYRDSEQLNSAKSPVASTTPHISSNKPQTEATEPSAQEK